jgi:diadenosine tetraphosphatase ApaH/serine/threonine PP2A family protein phosphatase
MKLALLSDLHANLRALHACLAHAREAGATHFAVLGDLVGYGAEPAQVVDAVMQLAAAGAVVLGGNHDAMAVQPPAQQESLGDTSAQVFCGHVHHQRLYYRGGGRALMEFMPTPGVAIPVPVHRQWLATVGSVGQPRDGDTRAMYALFDATQARLGFHRVAYDHRAAAAAMRHTAQPEFFAKGWRKGDETAGAGHRAGRVCIEDCIHSGGMAHIYRVRYADGRARPRFCHGHEGAAHDGGRRRRKHREL